MIVEAEQEGNTQGAGKDSGVVVLGTEGSKD